MVALHSSDPSTVYLAVWARVDDLEVSDLEHELYQERSLLRVYGMRRTLWVVDRGTLPLVDSSSTRALVPAQTRRLANVLETCGVADDGMAWLDDVIPKTLDAIRSRGEALARDITSQVPELAERIVFENKAGRVTGTMGASTGTLFLLGLQSRVIRARPVGSWVSGRYRWAEMSEWLGEPIEEVPLEQASAELTRMWLHSFGPGTETDLRWWTGWRVGQLRKALGDLEAVEVELDDGAIGYLLPDDLEPVDEPEPWVALLPSLDPTSMGWKERDWYLGDHYPTLFDRNGNAGPTVWVDGKVVGGWAQRRDGEIAHELFDDVGHEAKEAVESRVGELQDWIGDVTVTPRFRSPHDKALAG